MNSLKLIFLSIVAVFALSACDNSSKYLNPESGFVKLGNGWELHYPNTSNGNLRETTKNFGATYWYSDKKGNLLWYSCGLDSDSPNNFGYLLKGESSFFYRKKFETPIDVSIGQKNEK
ncbi:MAG: hypothetical protein IJ143_06750, partial [Neisseriaceae bacterium]|nr:hypothetical protein [Neisseriaceae bacterium]